MRNWRGCTFFRFGTFSFLLKIFVLNCLITLKTAPCPRVFLLHTGYFLLNRKNGKRMLTDGNNFLPNCKDCHPDLLQRLPSGLQRLSSELQRLPSGLERCHLNCNLQALKILGKYLKIWHCSLNFQLVWIIIFFRFTCRSVFHSF